MRPRQIDEVLRAVSRNVKATRRDAELSQEEAAHRAGLPVRQWQRVEAAQATTVRTLVAVAVALDVDLSELISRKQKP